MYIAQNAFQYRLYGCKSHFSPPLISNTMEYGSYIYVLILSLGTLPESGAHFETCARGLSVIGGRRAPLYPFYVAILIETCLCGGTIIAPNAGAFLINIGDFILSQKIQSEAYYVHSTLKS